VTTVTEQATTMTAQTIHPFAIFGAGPYTFARMQTTEDREALNAAAAAAGLPFTTNMCGGSCDLCGTAIWCVFWFRTADGREFKVGSECAQKAGEGGQVKQAKRDRKREVYEAQARATREQRLESERDANEALGHGRLTNDELAAKIEADREAAQQARRDASRHFGTVGERVKKVELRYEGSYGYESAFGIQRLYFLRRVDNDAAVVWKTSGGLGRTRADGIWEPIEKGHSFTATFTVKSHGEYKGEQQTKVERLTVEGPKKPRAPRKPRAPKTVSDQRPADEARTLRQQKLEALRNQADVLRDKLQKADDGHPFYVEHAASNRRCLELIEAELAEVEALG
jgi:hypothetical protein